MVTALTVVSPPGQCGTRPDEPAAGHGGPGRPRVCIVGGAALGLAMARAYPWVAVDLYEYDWCQVDRARALVEAGELSGRVKVHHFAAAALAGVVCEGASGRAAAVA